MMPSFEDLKEVIRILAHVGLLCLHVITRRTSLWINFCESADGLGMNGTKFPDEGVIFSIA